MSPLLIAMLVAQATVYTWTDKAGVEHFTDDLSTIPRGVKVRTTDGAEISYVFADEGKPVRPKEPAPVAAPVPAPVEAGPAAPSVAEQTWRQLFRAARNRVTVLEEEIEADRVKVEEVNGLPVSFGFNCGFYGGYGHYRGQVVPPITTTGVAVTATGQPAPGVSVGASVTGTTVIAPPLVVSPGAPVVGPLVPTFAVPCAFAFSPEFAMIRDRLDRNRRELPRAREELADLERRASFEAVPLHWRR